MSSSDDDSDMEWEQIVPVQPTAPLPTPVPRPSTSTAPLEITINAPAPVPNQSEARKAKAQADARRRLVRLTSHRMHTVALLASASIHNKWLNDDLLKARLLSLTPLPLHTSFSMITKKNQPDAALRGRQFQAALVRLAEWWAANFRVDAERGIRHQSFESVSELADSLGAIADSITSRREKENGKGGGKKVDRKGKGKAKEQDNDEEDDLFDLSHLPYGERTRSPSSLMKHALLHHGSPDMSAKLFTSLCRSLNLPARLVVSLQGVLWRKGADKRDEEKAVDRVLARKRKEEREREEMRREAGVLSARARNASSVNGLTAARSVAERAVNGVGTAGSSSSSRGATPSRSPKGKERATDSDGGAGGVPSDASAGSTSPSSKSKSKPRITLRKSKPTGRTLGGATPVPQQNKANSPPIFWTEVYSRPDGRWIPVNPIDGSVDKNRIFEPSPGDKFNRMLYVVAFEEDGFVKDVTQRYARNYVARVLKERSTGEKPDWWSLVLSFLTRTYRLHRDDVEEAEFDTLQLIEGMPTSMGAFKNHPLYALERHLTTTEVIHPRSTSQVGHFRGEPVFTRSSVLSLKSAENWLRSTGRVVRVGEQPLRMGKVRAATIGRRRAVEMALAERGGDGSGGGGGNEGGGGGEGVMQGLYARFQTEVFVPDPVVDGVVPKNEFGNIDLYTPSMLPEGAAHVPFKGCAKIARQLGFDFAEAVTGFEFKQRRAFPILQGVVVAAENEAALIEAYQESALAAQEKERRKKEERVTKLWTKMIQGLRIRERISSQYATGGNTVVVPNAKEDEDGGFIDSDTAAADASGAQQARGATLRTIADTLKNGGPPAAVPSSSKTNSTFTPVNQEDTDSVRVTHNPLAAPVRNEFEGDSSEDDGEMEEIGPSTGMNGHAAVQFHASATKGNGNGNGVDVATKRTPKSLSAFAAAHRLAEEAQAQAIAGSSRESTLSNPDAEDAASPNLVPPAETETEVPSAGRPRRSTRTQSNTTGTVEVDIPPPPRSTSAPKPRTQRTSRKRARRDSSESSSEFDGAGAGDGDGDIGEMQEEEEEYTPSRSKLKAKRKTTATATPRPRARSMRPAPAPAPAPAPVSDRVLRTRSSARGGGP